MAAGYVCMKEAKPSHLVSNLVGVRQLDSTSRTHGPTAASSLVTTTV